MLECWDAFWVWGGWNGVSAVSTAGAMFASLYAIYLAIVAPSRERAKDRSESTHEILRATAEAIDLFEKAKAVRLSSNDLPVLAKLAGQAGHQGVALDRLLNRSSLSDGAIITGAGALQLTTAIIKQYDTYKAATLNGSERPASDELAPLDSMVRNIEDRAQRVADYAVKRRWPKWRQRFLDTAENGLRRH